MKKKSSGVHRARLNARGYEQADGFNYDRANIASSVTNDISIKIVLVLARMAAWKTNIIDVKGELLHGGFTEKEEPVYMEIPHIFKNYLEKYHVLLLLKTLYSLKNVAYAFFY